MKRIVFVSAVGFLVLSFAFSTLTSAGPSGPSANGEFQFSLIDGQIRYLKFDVRTQKSGETHGQMTFSDPSAEVAPGEGSTGSVTSGASVTAEFDCLVIKGNAAVMSGVITQSNINDAIGQRVLLVVEDNGEGIDAPSVDKLTWGIYGEKARTWIAKDAERDDDPPVPAWLATDFERPDDVGVPSDKSTVIGCQSFPLSSYALVNVDHGFGNIQVRP